MKKNLLRLIVVVAALVGAAQWAAADELINILVIKSSNGDSYRIALYDQPKIALDKYEMTLTTANETIYLDALETIDFTWGNSAGVADIQVSNTPVFYWDGDVLKVYGLQPCEAISLYTAEGMTLYSGLADESGAAEVKIARKGVMIVKTVSKTIKFAK